MFVLDSFALISGYKYESISNFPKKDEDKRDVLTLLGWARACRKTYCFVQVLVNYGGRCAEPNMLIARICGADAVVLP